MVADSCIIFAYELDGSGGCKDALNSDEPGRHPVWTHMDYSAGDARSTLLGMGLRPYVVDTLTREESRPHALAVDDGLVIVLRGINRNAGEDPEDMVSMRIWLDNRRIITVRQRRLLAAQETAETLMQHAGPATTTDLLNVIIEKLADAISLFVDGIEERMEAYEDEIEAGPSTAIRSQISAVRRQIAAVRRYLAPMRDALESLHRLGGALFSTEQQFAVREQADRIARYIEDLDLVRERTLVAQEELMNRISMEQNNRTYVLSIVAAIFLPITFISGVFGMNTAGLPGLEHEAAFRYVAGAMVAVSVIVIGWLRAKKWF